RVPEAKETRWRCRRWSSCGGLLRRAEHPGNGEHESNDELIRHVDEEGVEEIHAEQDGPDLSQGSDGAGLTGRTVPREAEKVEKQNGVQGQPRQSELHQQSEVGVVHVKSAEVIALHAAGKLGVHATGSPAGERPLPEHGPAGVVHGEASLHRAALSGAIAKSSLQRGVAEADGQADYEARNRQQSACGLQTAFDQEESENDGGDGERDPNSARHGGEHGHGQSKPQQTDDGFAPLRQRKGKNPKDVQRNAVGYGLEKRAASAVGMKTKAFVKNEARKNERVGVGEEGNGNEHEVGERESDKDLKMLSLRRVSENERRKVKQGKGNDVFAGDDAPDLSVERLPKRAEHSQRYKAEHGQTESGKEWDLLAERHSAQGNEKDQDAEHDSVGVIRKEVWWSKQENGHRGDVKNGGKGQA